MPKDIRPNTPLEFERVLSITAKDKNVSEIEEVKANLRDILDSKTIMQTIENEAIVLESLNRQILERGPRVV